MAHVLTLQTVQGETDQTKTDVCDIIAVYKGDDNSSRLELHITDWAEVPNLTPGATLTVTP